MKSMCAQVHELAHRLPRHRFPYSVTLIPENGIYLLFEQGEPGHGGDRIARIGTHRGDGHLPGRLNEHFLRENKDRSIFRKNVGRTILNRADDPFLRVWDYDTLSRKARERYATEMDLDYRQKVEKQVTQYIQDRLSFVVIPVPLRADRLRLEKQLIGTVSLCQECGPSSEWSGLHSPKPQIYESGLWQVQHLYKEPLTPSDFDELLLLLQG